MFFRKPALESAKNSIERMSIDEKKVLGEWLKSSLSLSEVLSPAISELNRTLLTSQEEIVAKNKKCDELITKIKELENSVEEMEKPLLIERRIKELTREKRVLSDELTASQLEHRLGLEKINLLEAKVSQLKSDLQELTEENNALAHENHQLESQRKSFAPSNLSKVPLGNDLVVVTSQSRKFHRRDCEYLQEVATKFKTEKKRSEAIADGGRACRTCRP